MPDLARPGACYSDECSDAGHLLELLEASRPAWHADAACRNHPNVDFFPIGDESSAPAKAICASCAVMAACGAWAADQKLLSGVWGGLDDRERSNGPVTTGRARRRPAVRCTRCEEGAVCDACQERSTRRRLTDAELYPATTKLLARLA
ncbi:MAG: Transcription factor WhiB [Acidimicrobiaceae bacterium]|jgi:hypothetical protein|nr:Transcription factor WhiB [Acidimicrobiaceae bacterium]